MTSATTSSTSPELEKVSASVPKRGVVATAWSAVSAALGAVLGLLPHVLHHVTLLAGAAVVTGLAGNLVLGGLGLLLSIPLLRRLYRRFGSWKAPAAAVAAFVIMFSVSSLVIGPALISSETDQPSPGPAPARVDHESHHRG